MEEIVADAQLDGGDTFVTLRLHGKLVFFRGGGRVCVCVLKLLDILESHCSSSSLSLPRRYFSLLKSYSVSVAFWNFVGNE